MTRVVFVTSRSATGDAIRLALRQAGPMQVLGYVNGKLPVEAAIKLAKPDLVLVDDMDLPSTAVVRVAETRAAAPQARIVVLAADLEAEWLAEAMDAGADALVCKAMHASSLGCLVREIAAGRVYHRFRRATAAAQPNELARARLTDRELEVLRLMAAGASNNHIARQLWVTEQTVKFHLSNVYRKLGVANRTEASHFAHVNRLLDAAPPMAEAA